MGVGFPFWPLPPRGAESSSRAHPPRRGCWGSREVEYFRAFISALPSPLGHRTLFSRLNNKIIQSKEKHWTDFLDFAHSSLDSSLETFSPVLGWCEGLTDNSLGSSDYLHRHLCGIPSGLGLLADRPWLLGIWARCTYLACPGCCMNMVTDKWMKQVEKKQLATPSFILRRCMWKAL